MPTYGANKQRDIIKSVLPSTKRKGARDDRRNIHKKARAHSRQALTTACSHNLDDIIQNVDMDGTLYEYPTHEINNMKWERREGDKLGALIRWAPTQVQHLRKEDRISYIKALLPNNTIGRHAASHVIYEDSFYIPEPHNYYSLYTLTQEARAAKWKKDKDEAAANLRADLVKIITTGNWQREFNREFKDTHRWVWVTDSQGNRYQERRTKPGRPLLGLHDIEDFIKAHQGGSAYVAKFLADRVH
jgi:hypothetical protein